MNSNNKAILKTFGFAIIVSGILALWGFNGREEGVDDALREFGFLIGFCLPMLTMVLTHKDGSVLEVCATTVGSMMGAAIGVSTLGLGTSWTLVSVALTGSGILLFITGFAYTGYWVLAQRGGEF